MMACARIRQHSKFIKYGDFKNNHNNYKDQLQKRLLGNKFSETDYSDLHSFLLSMSDLTGLLLVLSDTDVEYFGTGFVVKLRRQRDGQCPCPAGHEKDKTEHAIVTISTAYHVFNEEDDEEEEDDDKEVEDKEDENLERNQEKEIKDMGRKGKIKTFDKVNETWDKYKTEFKLDYNDLNKKRDELKDDKSLPTLYGHKLIEMDKDLDYDCDWCAIECVTHDLQLVENLEGKISNYQKGLAELYKKSQLPMYKDINLVVIIGHPHNWAKKLSIGQTRKFRTAPEKEILKEVRSRQSWCRYSYDNLTCNGISGAPIFKWGQPITGFGYWFGHPHNHSEVRNEISSRNKRVYFGMSTIGVENIF